ncbi:unnamed protein product [Linum trigynum]|uniref:RNase H type-1 domain-containing protein n=1 Tax=Linum trigynum TaxID=586398 RepID=A0AAV2DS39_9ROSI
MAKKERGVCRPIEVETKALVMGLREANRRALNPLIVESDCQVLVNLLKNGMDDFLAGEKVKWRFTPRKSNSVAHWLAHAGLSWEQQIVWVENPPLSLCCLIEADLGQGPSGQN